MSENNDILLCYRVTKIFAFSLRNSDYFEHLPNEILIKILKFLPQADQVRSELVCKKWFETLQLFWKEITTVNFKWQWSGVSIDVFLRDGKLDRKRNIVCSWKKFQSASEYCFRQCGPNLTEVRVVCCAAFEDFGPFLLNMIDSCPNLQCIVLDNLQFKNSSCEQGLLSKLVTMEKLTHLAIRHCQTEEFKFDVFDNQILPTSSLTHLQLLGFNTPNVGEKDFVSLCQIVGPTLQYFYYVYTSIELKVLATAVKHLTNLQSLHISLFNSLDDEFLKVIARHCNKLESINLSGNDRITSNGINFLLQSSFGLEHLLVLNLEHCHLVDDTIYEQLKNRPITSSDIKIYAHSTNVSSDLVNSATQFCRWRVIINAKLAEDDDHIFGEIPTEKISDLLPSVEEVFEVEDGDYLSDFDVSGDDNSD